MAGMTNEEITNEFETLFGENEPQEEIDETPTEVEDEEETEEEEESKEEETEEEETEEESEDEEESEESEDEKKKAKQNYAFAQQRQQIKAQEKFIKSIGKLIGMEDAKPEEIQEKVRDVLLEKESKEQNVPVEILKRLENAEAIISENQRIKRENEVQNSLSDLIEKHDLDTDAINEFTKHLIENDKNPIDHPEVDLEAEYLKLHYEDMVKAAVAEALNKEKDRKEKVDKQGASSVPDGKNAPEEGKINTIEELDKLFGGMNL